MRRVNEYYDDDFEWDVSDLDDDDEEHITGDDVEDKIKEPPTYIKTHDDYDKDATLIDFIYDTYDFEMAFSIAQHEYFASNEYVSIHDLYEDAFNANLMKLYSHIGKIYGLAYHATV